MHIKIVTLLCLLVVVQNYDLSHLINKLNGYDKKWVSGLNPTFVNLTLQQTKQMMSTIMQQKQKVSQRQGNSEYLLNWKQLPKQLDARTYWPNCKSIPQIRNPSTCSSGAWALAAIQVMSDRICINSGQRQQVRLSALDLLECSQGGDGCNGGMPSAAWNYYKKSGIVTEQCKAFTGNNMFYGNLLGKCDKKCTTNESIDYKTDLHFAKDIYSVPTNVTAIQQQILTYGPVQTSFKVYQDFLTYKSGVYIHLTGSVLGAISVKILGWGTQNGVDYWLGASSWVQWGEKGYFKIRRGTNQCGLQHQFLGGIPVIKNVEEIIVQDI